MVDGKDRKPAGLGAGTVSKDDGLTGGVRITALGGSTGPNMRSPGLLGEIRDHAPYRTVRTAHARMASGWEKGDGARGVTALKGPGMAPDLLEGDLVSPIRACTAESEGDAEQRGPSIKCRTVLCT